LFGFRQCELPEGSVVGGLKLGRRDVVQLAVKTAVVISVDPFQHGELDLLDAAPWALWADQLGLEQPVDRLGQSVVVTVAFEPTDGWTPASASRSV
jgi:hypothetical protein